MKTFWILMFLSNSFSPAYFIVETKQECLIALEDFSSSKTDESGRGFCFEAVGKEEFTAINMTNTEKILEDRKNN